MISPPPPPPPPRGHVDLARMRAQRDALAKELETTKGLLATARQQALDLDAQRAEAVREMDEAEDLMHEAFAESCKIKELLVRCVNEGTDGGADDDVSLEFLSHVPAECAAIKKQRDEARAKLAELREAALALGEIRGMVYEGPRGQLVRADVPLQAAEAWIAQLAKLRADAAAKEGT